MRLIASVLVTLAASVCWAQENPVEKRSLRFTPARHLRVPIDSDIGSESSNSDKRNLFAQSRPVVFQYGSPCVNLPADLDAHDENSNNGWTLVDFCLAGQTGAGPASSPDCHHNDDDSSVHTLPFSFTLYGTDYTTVFINNNGNLSMERHISTFTPTGFPRDNFIMVAPFWADVDTGDQFDYEEYLGHVWMKELSPRVFAVTWENVGYFNENGDRLNSFQVLISDGTDLSMGLGNNVCYCYGDMEFTTGDASEGESGLGGIGAIVGTNKGDGFTAWELGRFDRDDFGDGPPNVDYLDGKVFCFNAAGDSNIPPIPVDFPSGGEFRVNSCLVFDAEVNFLSPEKGQTTTVSVTGAPPEMTVEKNQDENEVSIHLQMTPTKDETHVLMFKATDSEGAVTEKELTVDISGCCVDIGVKAKQDLIGCVNGLLQLYHPLPTYAAKKLNFFAKRSRAKVKLARVNMKDRMGKIIAASDRVMQGMKWADKIKVKATEFGNSAAIEFANAVGDRGSQCDINLLQNMINDLDGILPTKFLNSKTPAVLLQEARKFRNKKQWKLSSMKALLGIRVIMKELDARNIPVCV